MRFPTSALVVAVMLTRATASSAEIAAERNDRGGLRKGSRRRKLQNSSIICEAQGGVSHSGLVPTAPSYTDCYLNGCASTYSCTDSSQCAPGSCCMPTSWVFYGNYCVSVSQLDNLNQFARRKCLCREAERASASAGDTILSGGQVTVLGGEDVQEDNASSGPDTAEQQTEGDATIDQTTTSTTSATGCNGCMFDGKCVPTGVAWMRRDGCTRCYCKNVDGSGDYRCIDSQCPTTATATTATTTTNTPNQETTSQGQVKPATEVTPPKTLPSTTNLSPAAPQTQTNNEQQEPNDESEQTEYENNTQSQAGQTSDNTPTTDSNLQAQPEPQPQPQPEVPSSPQPPECTGCTVNGLCLPTGAQWVLTESSCTRRCVCFNKDQSGEYRCAPCPQDFAVSTPAVPATELNNNNNNDAQEEGDGGAASASAETSRVVPGFGTVGEEDGGGLFSEEDIINAELDVLNQPLLPP